MICKNLESVRRAQLELLNTFIDVCEKNNLRYFVWCGTLLGAVREGGMIPWDYDVDVCMPIEDYNKLYALNLSGCAFSKPVYLSTFDGCYKFRMNHQLKMEGTTATKVDERLADEQNIFLDIYPMFKMGNDKESMDIILRTLKSFCHIRSLLMINRMGYHGRSTIKTLDGFLLANHNRNKDSNIYVSMHDVVGNCLTEDKITEERVNHYSNIVDFDKFLTMDFSGLGRKVRVPENYDEILRNTYGDYMIPVDESKENRDDINFLIDGDVDYTVYKSMPEDQFRSLFTQN